MKLLKTLLAAGAISVASASAASALTVTFSFDGVSNAGVPSVGPLVQSGISLTVDAQSTNEARTVVTSGVALVTQSQSGGNPNLGGLGVRSTPTDESHSIEGNNGINDLLRLVFGQKVRLVSALFSNVDGDDDFDLWMSGAYVFTAATPAPLAQYAFGGLVDDEFGFGAIGRQDNYKLKSITVSTVPLPPAALLLVTGLLGIGALGRRKRKQNLAV